MRLHDTRRGYGWISIALHWIAAATVIVLWVLGSSIETAGPFAERRMHLHTSIALSAYALLWFRIIWRLIYKHPGPLPAQAGWAFAIGKWTHYVLILAIGMQLVTGPLMVWSRGQAIHLFAVRIPGPFGAHWQFAQILLQWHSWTATVLIVGTLLHIAGVLKHVVFNRDATLDKMMVASKEAQDHPADSAPRGQ